MAEEKKLEVKDLRISFKTMNGKVQAVRDINFDLYKGETLAIVGESGSGKSVTSRAIMGILAGNAIVEGGKILYGDKDLLKISEEEFHHIRGDKISMVFQDPLSSLNPIMRIGAQLTEAMLLKNKASRRESKKSMNAMFNALSERMAAAGIEGAKEDIEKFKKFSLKHCELQAAYTDSFAGAEQALALAQNLILYINNNAVKDMASDVKELENAARKACSRFVVYEAASDLNAAASAVKKAVASGRRSKDYSACLEPLQKMADILSAAVALEVPNTFTLGYYLTYEDSSIPDMPTAQLNEMTHEKTATHYMDAFLEKVVKVVKYSAEQTDKERENTIKLLKEQLPVFTGTLEKSAVDASVKRMKPAVLRCLDPLEVEKDSLTYTFASSIDYAVNLYFTGGKRNEKEEKRFASETKKYNAIVAKGKVPEWSVIPASYIDLDAAKQEMEDLIHEMIAHYEKQIINVEKADFAQRAEEVIDYLKEVAQESVNKITRETAKEKAIKLMESVGIDDPRRRFHQYPFEFSGGMRQRIVIAIALTANPDILICDEPTTALDVTIQAQILELINNLKRERNLSVIFITHDLGVVANMADRIAVMYAGKIVEYGTASDIFYSPAHPYTWALLSSVPDLETKEKLESIPGTPPNMIYPPKGDAFADRNKYALEIDFEEQPPMFKINDTHYAATWLLHPNAPKIEPPKIITERIERMKKIRGGAAQ